MSSKRIAHRACAIAALLLAAPVAADSWRAVHAGSRETVEIDSASVARGFDGITAWSRVRLDRQVVDGGGNYDTIRAQNLYNCGQRRFTTLRRAFFLGETLVREEDVARRRANPVQAGSLDERLLNVACERREAEQVASGSAAPDRNSKAASATGDRPVAMHADMRKAGEGEGPRVFAVADSTAEKPKLIQLPQIDKAALAQAAAAQDAAARTDGRGKPASAPSVSTAGKLKAGKADTKEPEALTEKRIRELHYANSGPPRTVRKKAPAAPALEGAENPAASMHKHWSYEGETGPAHWARLRPDYAACASGKRQSPIDIRDGIRVNLENIRFDYKPMQFRIVDNGHTVQVNAGEGSSLNVMGKRYALQQFHFHRPSEERVNGRMYDMSVHFVHRNDEGQLAVVAVLLEKGAEHPLIQTLLNNLPLEQDSEMAPEESIDPSVLLPENRAYWTYMGSLTTPPCTEGVLWMVMKQPLQVAGEQVAIFSRVFRNNSRPVQPANGRLIKETR
jgi:carbonic anhydrase